MAPRMVFIYGPPAVGKLTVARIVGERLGFGVLHNQLAVDAVLPVLPFEHPEFAPLVSRIRADIIGAAHRAGRDVVLTYWFGPGEETHVDRLVGPYEGNALFVRLVAPIEVLRERVLHDSRKAYGKVVDVDLLDSLHERYDFDAQIVGRESVVLDTAVLSAEEAADRIAELAA